MPNLYSYVIDHDYGFAPNPFWGMCTLATCKPIIRKNAARGDYIVGTGCARRRRQGYLVYFMKVDEISDYDRYWMDGRFAEKRPFLRGSKVQEFGDNIYHRDPQTQNWVQENSFHSLKTGPNPLNVDHDTQTDRVLIGREFAYWGGSGPQIPERFRNWSGQDVCARRGHRRYFPEGMAEAFIEWMLGLGERGYLARPLDWPRTA